MLCSLIYLLMVISVEAIVVHPLASDRNLNFTYHSHQQMVDVMRRIGQQFPQLASVYSIGKSVRNKELMVLRLSSPYSSVLGTPNVKYVGNIHGNEPVGRELILHLAEYLVTNYEVSEEVKWIMDKTVIHLLPSMNPDGFEKAHEGDCDSKSGRGNGNSIDLNRSFPDIFQENPNPRQPETEAIIDWLSRIKFVLSASFHGGSVLANYPFDNAPKDDEERDLPRYSATPDDETFRHLAQSYADSHATMHKGNVCDLDDAGFVGGISNGAAWYKITGGMQDYNYVEHGCMELTLEISCCKYPSSSQLPRLWNENKKALVSWLKEAHKGIRGLVLDSVTGKAIPSARMNILGRNINFTSAETGEFWRILLPGDYTVRVIAEGYEIQLFPFTVREVNTTYPEATWLNIYLRPSNPSETDSLANRSKVNRVSSVKALLVLSPLLAAVRFP